MMMKSALYQTNLSDFYSANSLKQQFADRHVGPLRHIILIPSKPVFFSFSLMLRTQRRSDAYQFNWILSFALKCCVLNYFRRANTKMLQFSYGFDASGTRTRDQPHTKLNGCHKLTIQHDGQIYWLGNWVPGISHLFIFQRSSINFIK